LFLYAKKLFLRKMLRDGDCTDTIHVVFKRMGTCFFAVVKNKRKRTIDEASN
jgi:hypothetical protein